jgi:hypothetical protein
VSIYRLTNGYQITLIRAALELESGKSLIGQLDCMAHTRGIAQTTQKTYSPASQKQKTRSPVKEAGLRKLISLEANRSKLPDGLTENRFIRYYWQGGLEFSLMMLDYYGFTGDKVFASETLLPLASEILTFFDQHWQRDANGKIRFDPAMALETYNQAVNPIVEIVGIEKVCQEMLALPKSLTYC